MVGRLVPDDFAVPQSLVHARFTLRPLTVNDVVKDYDAVMTSIEHLRAVFGPGSSWPDAELTLEQDLIDLGWHQKEFQRRTSFAYTVVAPDESRVLGCVYLYPPDDAGADADVYLWVRKSELAHGLDGVLEAVVRHWLAESWPFRRPRFPGRVPSPA